MSTRTGGPLRGCQKRPWIRINQLNPTRPMARSCELARPGSGPELLQVSFGNRVPLEPVPPAVVRFQRTGVIVLALPLGWFVHISFVSLGAVQQRWDRTTFRWALDRNHMHPHWIHPKSRTLGPPPTFEVFSLWKSALEFAHKLAQNRLNGSGGEPKATIRAKKAVSPCDGYGQKGTLGRPQGWP